ncbi:hypothetical protein D3C80_1950900 [compost metagenome]
MGRQILRGQGYRQVFIEHPEQGQQRGLRRWQGGDVVIVAQPDARRYARQQTMQQLAYRGLGFR